MTARPKATRKRAARRKSTPAPKPENAQPRALTRAELASWLGVSRTTVDNWALRGCPRHGPQGKSTYLLPEVFAWIRERERIAAAEEKPADIDLEELRKRRALAETELAELQLEEARALVVPFDVVIERVGERLAAIRARFLTFPSRYAAAFARIPSAPKMKAALREAVRELLEELSTEHDIARDAREEGKRAPRVRGKARGRAPRSRA